jgi:pimeloyl-ACP methyl ester carboxylesterase
MPLLSVNGTQLHYIQTGEGPEVVLVHGLASSLAFWYSGIVLPLRHQYRVTAYDLRGHGKSGMPPTGYTHLHMADDLFHFIEQLKLKPFHLVGHSYGGLISLSFALRYPGRLKSLTLADVPISDLTSDWMSCWPVLGEKLQKAGIHICREEPYPELQILEELARPQVRSQIKETTTDSLFTPYAWGKGSGKTAKRWLELLKTTTARSDIRSRDISFEDLENIEVPTLLTYGMKSQWRSSGNILSTYPMKHKVAYVENAGHAHPWERPGDFLRSWLDFIASVEETISYPGIERRTYRRYEVRIRLDVWVDQVNLHQVESVNISMSGILVMCSRPMESGSEVEFLLPSVVGNQRATVKGRVVRQVGDLSDNDHLLGIKFLLDGKGQARLNEWIEGVREKARADAKSV